MKPGRVLNYRAVGGVPPGAVYIGRPRRGQPGRHGNPFVIGRDGDRAEVVRKHAHWLRTRIREEPAFRAEVLALRGRDLVCWCAPEACHGDTYILVCEELAAEAA